MMRQDRLSASAVATIKKHARVIAHAPGDEFHCSATLAGDGDTGLSFYDIDTDIVMQLSYTGIFKRTGSTKRTDRGGSRVKTWTCPDEYRERAQAVLDGWDSPIGCGHTGVRNIPGGGFTCTTDDCDVEVPREGVDL
jgi:hypothetical protein